MREEAAKINTLLWDLDGTLLDFLASEKVALRQCFALFGLGACDDDRVARYSAINVHHWERLERGELTKSQVKLGRFEEFFAAEGIDTALAAPFDEAYEERLGSTVVFLDDSYEVVKRLRGRVRQYVVTNGTEKVQIQKLTRSGLGELLDGVFISDVIGAQKPSPVFFDRVLAKLGNPDRRRVMVVGDSLTGDMQGGMNAGIVCCWYNPEKAPRPEQYRIDYEIADLNEVEALIGR